MRGFSPSGPRFADNLCCVAQYHYLRRHPAVKQKYGKTPAVLEANPHHPSLRLHALAGKHEGLHSVSINLSYRVTLELRIRGQTIIPVNVDGHDDVYG